MQHWGRNISTGTKKLQVKPFRPCNGRLMEKMPFARDYQAVTAASFAVHSGVAGQENENK